MLKINLCVRKKIMIPDKVKEVLDKYGLTAMEFEKGSTPTAEMAAKRLGVSVSQIAKSILLRGKDEKFYMIIIEGDAKLSSSKAKKLLGTKVKMASPEESLKVTGFYPGGICPFGLKNIDIFLDKGLARYDIIYPAAGTDASGVPVTFEKLKEITDAKVCDVVKNQ